MEDKKKKDSLKTVVEKAKSFEYKAEEVITPVRKYRPSIKYEDHRSEEELKRVLNQPLPDVFASLNHKFSSRKN